MNQPLIDALMAFEVQRVREHLTSENVNQPTFLGVTPLHIAVALYGKSIRRGREWQALAADQIAEMLLEKGANPYIQDRQGQDVWAITHQTCHVPKSLRIWMSTRMTDLYPTMPSREPVPCRDKLVSLDDFELPPEPFRSKKSSSTVEA